MKIALVANRWPWPPRRGDQLRAVQLSGVLQDHFDLTVLAPEPPGGGPPETGDASMEVISYPVDARDRATGILRAAVSGRPLQAGLARSRKLLDLLDSVAPDLIIVQLARLGPWLAPKLGGAPMIIDLIDSLSLNFEQRARFDSGWKRPLLRLEAKRLASAEEDLIARSKAAVLVAERDRAFIARRLRPELAARLAVIPLASVAPGRTVSDSGVADGHGPVRFVITGSLGYFPTAEGLGWWLRAVWPRVRERLPDARLTVAGSRAGRKLVSAIRRAGAELVADPESFDQVLRGASASLVPLRAGSGLPIKILEAWRAGVPVVATAWAAAGIGGRDGADLLVAEDAEAWVSRLVDLSEDPNLGRRLSAGGSRRLETDFGADRVGHEWLRLIDRVLA